VIWFYNQPLAARVDVLGKHHIMEDAGQRLRRIRDRLNLRVRDVELASQHIAEKHRNDEFAILINRLSEIENRGLVPNIFKLYSLCAIYRLDFLEVLEWYGVALSQLPADAAAIEVPNSHLLHFKADAHGEVMVPLTLDPGLDIRRTTYVSRMIQRWGKIPLLLLDQLELKDRRYAFLGSEDWFMFPLLQPASLLMIDETQRKIANSGWENEFDRPIYFLEHREGYACGWCSLDGDQLLLLPHPASRSNPKIFDYRNGVDIIGRVTGVAMTLDQGRRRQTYSSGASIWPSNR
jgi:transcriptional regulator with XRE-family HTH domain